MLYKVITDSTENFLQRLRAVTIEEQPFIKPNGIFFLGKVKNSHFKLITFNSPPTELEFTITNTFVTLGLTVTSLTDTFKMLIYALLFPLFIGLFAWSCLDDSVPIAGKLLCCATLILPFLLNKVIKYFYESYVLLKIEDLLKNLKQQLKADLQELNP